MRQGKGVSQGQLAKKLGYVTNSYVSDMEKGKFIPSQEKLKELAKALRVPFAKIKDLLLEARLEEMGIKGPGFISLVKDYPRLSREDQGTIIKAYLKVRNKKERSERRPMESNLPKR